MIVRAPLDLPMHRLSDAALRPIAEKLGAGERLDDADALTLFDSPDLLGVGALADAVNRAKHGNRVTFAANQHINPTNVCVLRKTCVFCGYARLPKEDGAYRYTLEQVLAEAEPARNGLTKEFHIVGGMTPSRTTNELTTNSNAPAAPSMWPVADLVELTLMVLAQSPNTALMARVSLKSFAGVDVPCAFT